MKKYFTIFGMLLLLGAASHVQAQTVEALGNRARAAAHSCWQPLLAPHATVDAQWVLVADCIIDGEFRTGYGFNIVVNYNCPPRYASLCDPLPPVVAAFVYINCEGDVEVVNCF